MMVQNKRLIRIIFAFAAAVGVMLVTFFAAMFLIEHKLGGGVYTVKVFPAYVLSLVAGLSMGILLYPTSEEDEYDEEPPALEAEEESDSPPAEVPQIDESIYPELFSREVRADTDAEAVSYPDIKRFIGEQKAEADIEQVAVSTQAAWDEFVGARETADAKSDLYKDIPSELPEGYVPNYGADDSEQELESEEEEVPEEKGKSLFIKIAVTAVLAVLAVILPANMMTVYTGESVIKYGVLGKTEYKYAEADHYNVGVKLSGDVSIKVYFGSDEFELVFDGVLQSDEFASSFISSHSYAAYCDRLMKRSGVDKNITNLTSLTGVPESQYSYVNEITEGYLEEN